MLPAYKDSKEGSTSGLGCLDDGLVSTNIWPRSVATVSNLTPQVTHMLGEAETYLLP